MCINASATIHCGLEGAPFPETIQAKDTTYMLVQIVGHNEENFLIDRICIENIIVWKLFWRRWVWIAINDDVQSISLLIMLKYLNKEEKSHIDILYILVFF